MTNNVIKEHKFYGYKMVQNPSNHKMALFVGAIDAQILRDVVSVDNAVKWDASSSVWRDKGRNRTIIPSHWKSIEDFLSSNNLERILPSPIIISVDNNAFEFSPFPEMESISQVIPGTLKIKGYYKSIDERGKTEPIDEKERSAWVLDGQHRIMAFRNWSMPNPYPINVVVIQAWKGDNYEDVMRHQTYELNMGRPLSDDFKAAIREQYTTQIGHKDYKRQIALSWIRKNLESRGEVFHPEKIVGAPNLRPNYVITMSFCEKLIELAYKSDSHLKNTYVLEKIDQKEVEEIGKYLFDFFEGVRLSIGLLNPNTKGTIGTEPEVEKAHDYWDIAVTTKHKQRLLHNVGLQALVIGLLNEVMRGSDPQPKNPLEVAEKLDHMRGIAWHETTFQSKKDDWVVPLADALKVMYRSQGTNSKTKKYTLILEKKDKKTENVIDKFVLEAYGWKK